LGKDAINVLAVDGKGGKAELLAKVAQWVAARGRSVTQPGEFDVNGLLTIFDDMHSHDCIV